tara:strand:+ start:94 stop:330 length:237 start_codon:yes stop_codon:yes gene_type:complete
MVNIAILKVDPRGRLNIPMSFLKSNGINPSSGNCVAVMKPKYNSNDVVFEFIEEVDEGDIKLKENGRYIRNKLQTVIS